MKRIVKKLLKEEVDPKENLINCFKTAGNTKQTVVLLRLYISH